MSEYLDLNREIKIRQNRRILLAPMPNMMGLNDSNNNNMKFNSKYKGYQEMLYLIEKKKKKKETCNSI